MGNVLLSRFAFLPDVTGFAYFGALEGELMPTLLGRSLEGGIGDAEVIGPSAENTSFLAREGDDLIFQVAQDSLYLTPAELAADQSTLAVQIPGDPSLMRSAWLAAEGSAMYFDDGEDWWVADLSGPLPSTAATFAVPPDEGAIRQTVMSEARNRLLVWDIDVFGGVSDPLHYLTLDGADVSTPIPVPIPAGKDGPVVLRLELSRDGNRAYIVASASGEEALGLYAVDLVAGGPPVVSPLAVPDGDDESAAWIDLSPDEDRVYYADFAGSPSMMMVDADGGSEPIDMAPGYLLQGGAGTPFALAEDGRAVFFRGLAEGDTESNVFRVGIVDGQLTEPVAMGVPVQSTEQVMALYAAPDGGGVAYIVGERMMFSMYGEGQPTSVRLSAEGQRVTAGNAPPLFVAAGR